jgi:hypothetical protein
MCRHGNIKRVIISGTAFLFLTAFFGSIIWSCGSKSKEEIILPKIPYPDPKLAIYLQAQVDSSRYTWYTDVRAMVSSFCNEEIPIGKDAVTVGDVTVLSESIYHARAKVLLKDKTFILTMERAFKEKGTNSIWQVVKMEEKKE